MTQRITFKSFCLRDLCGLAVNEISLLFQIPNSLTRRSQRVQKEELKFSPSHKGPPRSKIFEIVFSSSFYTILALRLRVRFLFLCAFVVRSRHLRRTAGIIYMCE